MRAGRRCRSIATNILQLDINRSRHLSSIGGIQKRKNATSMRSAIPLRKVPDIPRISTLSSIIVKHRQSALPTCRTFAANFPKM